MEYCFCPPGGGLGIDYLFSDHHGSSKELTSKGDYKKGIF
jgi:hypothetical protein